MNFRILLTIPLFALSMTVFGQNHATVRIMESATNAKIIIVRASGEPETIELEKDNGGKKSDGVTEANLSKINSMLDTMESEGYELKDVSTIKDVFETLTTMIFRKK